MDKEGGDCYTASAVGKPNCKYTTIENIYMKTMLLCLSAVLVLTVSTVRAYTREEVVKRGQLRCGVSTSSPGFSSVDAQGRWTGLDVDICRAVAAAVLGDAEKVDFLPLAENESFTALLSGEVDVLSRHSAWTFTQDAALAVHFVGVSYYDGQGFLISTKLGAKQARDLKKVKVCSPVGSVSEINLIDYFERNKVDFKIVPYETLDLAVKGFAGGSCDVISLQQSQLYGLQISLADPGSAIVLPDVISKEPLGPVVRQGDDIWFDIVKWSLFAMLNAEELGITSGNIEEMRISNRLAVKRLFGLEKNGAKAIGLRRDWASLIIAQVGNYGEVFERNFGVKSPLKVDRGLNKLWTQGGLQYGPPLR